MIIKNAFNDVSRVELPTSQGIGGDSYLDRVAGMQVGQGSTVMRLLGGQNGGLWMGGKTPAEAPFYVDMNGNVIANSIDLGAAYVAAGGAAADINANSTKVSGVKIVDLSITSTQISNNSISTPKLQANAVTANEIATNAITSDKVSANAIIAGKIAANAVTASEIAANAVTATKILAGAVTADKISVTSLSAISATLGSVTVGGSADALGTISLRNSSNTEIAKLNNSGIIVRNTRGLFFEETTSGRYWDLSVNSSSQAVMSLPSTNQFFIKDFSGTTNLFTISSSQAFSEKPFAVNGAVTCKELFLNYGQNEGNIRNVNEIHGYNDLKLIGNGEITLRSGGSKVKIDDNNLDLDEHNIDAVQTIWAYNFNNRSDQRLKTKISSLDTGLDKILHLKPKSYEFKREKGKIQFGLLAQDVQEILPEIVHADDTGMLSISSMELIPFLVGAIQDLYKMIKELKGKNAVN